ncbi:MAG TPA: DedA family protein [Mycobacteriales bacterium]|nr:DedA family protein [Mycobacteriales bacterium]
MHQQLAVNLLSASSLISSFGTLGIAIILFAETGLLIGLFLPGDTLLFTAGVLTTTSSNATVHLQLGWVLIAVVVGALTGSQTGFLLGRSAGPRWFTDRRPRIAAAQAKTAEFIEHYGVRKAIVLSRFVPIVRTAMSPLLGSLQVPTGTFTVWQTVSGVIWTIGITLAGWGVGSHISNIDHYLLPIVAVIVAISLLPVALEFRKSRRTPTGPA